MILDVKKNNILLKKLVLILLIFGMACKGQKKVSEKNMTTSNGAIVLLLEENYSGLNTSENIIIKNQKSLNNFFSKINRTRKPGIPVPVVDFKKETLVVLCSGELESSKTIDVELVLETEEEIQLKTVYKKNKTELKAIISPFKIYKIPVSNKKISFKQ